MISGTVVELQIFPVKSLPGLRLDAVDVTGAGLAGDRAFVLRSGADTLVGKHHPRLRELALTGSWAAPLVGAPDGEPGDLGAVARFLGVPEVRLERAEGGARQVAAVHVVTVAMRADPTAGDSSRANLVLALAADARDLEPDQRVAVGRTQLLLGTAPRHCAGLFAEVTTPGHVALGDPVRRVDAVQRR